MADINIIDVELKSCSLNLGELHRLNDYGYFSPIFECITKDGEEFTAKMRLHITESLDPIVFMDPRSYDDCGLQINSVNSPILKRKKNYNEITDTSRSDSIFLKNIPSRVPLYRIKPHQIKKSLLNGYQFPEFPASLERGHKIAFTCHDPSIVGGGNLILFRYINWLSELGITSTVYSCGSLPSWTRVSAEFRLFSSYEEMFSAITENTIILFAMWHIEPMLQTNPFGKRIFMFHQGVVSYHYGTDETSMLAKKPVIDLLESLPLGTITISPYLNDKYASPERKEHYFIPNGVNFPLMSRPEKKENGRTLRLITVGSPSYCLKGTPVIAEALKKLVDQDKTRKVIWIACSGDDEVFIPHQIKNYTNIEYIHHLKLTRDEITEMYQASDIFINASLNEGFGLPSLEAMSCGVPVIQADNGGLTGIVEHGKDCLIVPINNADAVAEAIRSIIDDRNLAQRLIEHGYETAKKNNIVNQFEYFHKAFEKISGIDFNADQLEKIKIRLTSESSNYTEQRELKSPLVSIVIPTYNQANYLREALDSIIAQTYVNWETIVVNDGSRDNTIEVMQEYATRDSRIRVFSKENGGISSALNYGIEQAVGDYFCWLSSDDLFYDYKLEHQIKTFRDLDDTWALIYGGYDLFIQERNQKIITKDVDPIESGAEFPEMLKNDFIYGCSVMIRMNIIKDIGAFHPRYRHAQDTEFWLRIASRGYRFYLLNEKLAIRREHIEQASTGNIIYCRYDAVCMIDFYLNKYHLFEMYRYFNMNSIDDVDRFINHLVGRFHGEDPSVNNPMLREKFWDWIDEGLKILPPDRQHYILKKCLEKLNRIKLWDRDVVYFADRCKESLGDKRIQEKANINYIVDEQKNILLNNREKDESNKTIYEYLALLLLTKKPPLFAQTLQFHNTNKLINNRFKLAHSAIRYLSQYDNDFQNACIKFNAISDIPETQDDATRLFYKIYIPTECDRLININFAKNEMGLSTEDIEDLINNVSNENNLLIKKICSEDVAEPLMYYWNAVIYANDKQIGKALIEAFKIPRKKRTDVVKAHIKMWWNQKEYDDLISIVREMAHVRKMKIIRAILRPIDSTINWSTDVPKKVTSLISVLFRRHLNNYKLGRHVFDKLKILRNKLVKLH